MAGNTTKNIDFKTLNYMQKDYFLYPKQLSHNLNLYIDDEYKKKQSSK